MTDKGSELDGAEKSPAGGEHLDEGDGPELWQEHLRKQGGHRFAVGGDGRCVRCGINVHESGRPCVVHGCPHCGADDGVLCNAGCPCENCRAYRAPERIPDDD
jgi:hypothetical protein